MLVNGKQKIFSLFILMTGILFVIGGVSYARFVYQDDGNKVTSITTKGVTFKYTEGDNAIGLNDAMPMTDSQGKAQSNYFEFNISSSTPKEIELPYYIIIKKSADSSNIDEAVRLYLTEVDNDGNEKAVELINYDELYGYTNGNKNLSNYTERLLYRSKISEDTNTTITYRLRLWINEKADFTQEKYNNARFGVTINVYSMGEADYNDKLIIPKLTSIMLWQGNATESVSTTNVTVGSNVYTSISNDIIAGNYWYGNNYKNVDVLAGEEVYITSLYGSQTRWYTANDESAYLCTGARLVGTMPSSDTSIYVYPDIKGRNDAKRRVITGLENLRCE